ncbi:Repressor ROX1 [Mycena venus]|uniref:Repressor ROX1 n=1 Tax=Mycena venus TaxID=2733690 RepID=A0A8H6XJG6_9AGAR|nr:Repressor ROX1 [Mycena venus]
MPKTLPDSDDNVKSYAHDLRSHLSHSLKCRFAFVLHARRAKRKEFRESGLPIIPLSLALSCPALPPVIRHQRRPAFSTMPPQRTHDTYFPARSLEVNTTAPPSLTIISPTPRAFTFPVAHNLADSPYSSPSNSPFEPDLRALALSASSSSPSTSVSSHNDECRTPPPLSAFTRTLSPVSAPSSPSAPVRRKSTSSAVGAEERRPKKGDDDYVKRPENAFILFRRKCCEDRALSLSSSAPSSMKQRQADLSKTISQQWKALSPEERAKWEALAKEKKREHEALHPNYVYRPQRTSNKNRVNASASGSSSSPTQRRKQSAPSPRQIEFIVPTPRAQHGRSASAPTPPPHQAVQIPNVYIPSSENGSFSPDGSESPTSLFTRYGVGNGSGGFDYMPSFAAFDFESSLQSSDFLRAMFPPDTSPPSASTGGVLSPVSSTSGSGPSSPYTPANSSFHPSEFSCVFSGPSTASVDTSSYAQSSDLGLGLESTTTGEPAVVGGMEANDYSSYASAWAATSPWASTSTSAGLAEGDFDIGRIPEIGWDLGCAAFPIAQPTFNESEFASYEGGEPSAELDMHFGDMDMGMGGMGFDEMMAGRGF